MYSLNPHFITFSSLTIALMLLSGCTSDDIKEATSNNDANISYINALDEHATFYIKKRRDSGSIYSNQYKAISLPKSAVSNEIKHTWYGFEQSEVSVEDTNSRNNQFSMQELFRDKHNYWSVAWLDNTDYQISIFEKKASNIDNLYRVRIFPNGEYPVYINGNTASEFVTRTGKLSDYISIEACTGLYVSEHNIDLCMSDIGKSYLVVVDANGLISLTEEK